LSVSERHPGKRVIKGMSAAESFGDHHVHTSRCGHATGRMEEYVAHARQNGLSEMGFSDHLYMYWLAPEERDPELAMAEQELDEYVDDVLRLRWANPDLTIRLSIEADFIPGREAELSRIIERYPWDYVLGSVHFIDNWGFDDSRYLATYERWDIDELYERYFALVMQAAETGLFDSMSHADLIKKFGHRPSPDFSLNEIYERIATCFKKTSVCVEVNTSGLHKPCAEIYPALGMLRACQRAGVPATLGSDAHRPDHVGLAFDQAAAHLRDGGYENVIGFARRERMFRWLP
jgi:histidinol-phosphatase (PHP family)